MTGLYIHIPFCRKKCKYCDFYSLNTNDELMLKYCDAVVSDIKKYAAIYANKKFDSLFVGGGTPTILGDKLCSIIDSALNSFDFEKDAEITTEANPESLNLPLLKSLKSIGVNRISIGVQSFDDEQLKILGRIHDSDMAKRAIYNIKSSGIDNFNIDLMFAIPDYRNNASEFIPKWQNTLDTALDFSPAHISAYSLTLEKNAPLMRMTDLIYPSEDDEDVMYKMLCQKAKDNGFKHYEISNYCKDGYECRHNMKYWSQEEYLGLGPGAHSYIDNQRLALPRKLAGYITKDHLPDILQNITEEESVKERILTGLRTYKGISYSEIGDYYNINMLKDFANKLQLSGLAENNGDGFSLTERGYRVSNTIINTVLSLKKV